MTTHNTIAEDLKAVLDITSRVDERMRILMEGQEKLSERLNSFTGDFNQLVSRVVSLESKDLNKMHDNVDRLDERLHEVNFRVGRLEQTHNTWLEKAKNGMGLIYQGVLTVITAYILWKLGLPIR